MRVFIVVTNLMIKNYSVFRNNDENAFLGSSGIAFVYSLISFVNTMNFILP